MKRIELKRRLNKLRGEDGLSTPHSARYTAAGYIPVDEYFTALEALTGREIETKEKAFAGMARSGIARGTPLCEVVEEILSDLEIAEGLEHEEREAAEGLRESAWDLLFGLILEPMYLMREEEMKNHDHD